MEFKLVYWYWLVFGMVLIIANAVAYINIVSPEKSVYGVEDYRLAIQNLVQTSKDNELPVMFLLGEKYIEALKNLSTSENSKVIVLPGDIPAAVRGLISAVGK